MAILENENQELWDLDLVSQEMMEEIYSAVMSGADSMKESFIRKSSPSLAEFIASCEFAESAGLELVI